MSTDSDSAAVRKAKELHQRCRILKSTSCKHTKIKTPTWPEPETVRSEERVSYTQKHKGSLSVHSNRTSRMLWTAALVRIGRQECPDRQVLVVGSDTFCRALYNPVEFKRLLDLSGKFALSAGSEPSKCTEAGPADATEETVETMDWHHNLRVIRTSREKHKAEMEDWDGHLSHLPEDYRGHPYTGKDFYKNHLVWGLADLAAAFGRAARGSSSLEARFYSRFASSSREMSVAAAQRDLDALTSLMGMASGRGGPACFGGCPVAPQCRIRPLYTHPAEERDRQPRFRPLFNTTVIWPDADQAFHHHPELSSWLLAAIRREPTCQAHYNMSEFRLSQLLFSTSALESLCLPQPLRASAESTFSLVSESWVPSSVVSTASLSSADGGVGVHLAHPGADLVRTTQVQSNMVLRLPPPFEALATPADLFRQAKERELLVSVVLPPPVVPGLETDRANGKDYPTSLKNVATDPAEMSPLVGRYMAASVGGLSNADIQCKLDLVAASLLANMYGKHLVVTHDDEECLRIVADAVMERMREKDLTAPNVPPGFDVWQVGSTPRPRENAARPFLCLLGTPEAAATAMSEPRSLFRGCAAFLCTRKAFLSVGFPRNLGILHVYLLQESVQVTAFHHSPRLGGVDVVHVWDYVAPVASAVPGSEARSLPSRAASIWQPPPKICSKSGSKSPFLSGCPSELGLGRQLEYLGKAAESAQTAYAVLEGVAEYERLYFGRFFDQYVETGASVHGVLRLLRDATTQRGDNAERALRMCESWRARSGVSDAQYHRVMTAVQAIVGSDRFRIFGHASRTRRCGLLQRKMAANSIIMFNVRRELEGLQAMLSALRTSSHTAPLSPHFCLRAINASGVVTDLLSQDGARPGGSASALVVAAAAGAKVTLLDRLRVQTMRQQVELWRQFLACHGVLLALPGSAPETRRLVCQAVACSEAMAMARSLASEFQTDMARDRSVVLPGAEYLPVLFSADAGGGLRGGGRVSSFLTSAGNAWGRAKKAVRSKLKKTVRAIADNPVKAALAVGAASVAAPVLAPLALSALTTAGTAAATGAAMIGTGAVAAASTAGAAAVAAPLTTAALTGVAGTKLLNKVVNAQELADEAEQEATKQREEAEAAVLAAEAAEREAKERQGAADRALDTAADRVVASEGVEPDPEEEEEAPVSQEELRALEDLAFKVADPGIQRIEVAPSYVDGKDRVRQGMRAVLEPARQGRLPGFSVTQEVLSIPHAFLMNAQELSSVLSQNIGVRHDMLAAVDEVDTKITNRQVAKMLRESRARMEREKRLGATGIRGVYNRASDRLGRAASRVRSFGRGIRDYFGGKQLTEEEQEVSLVEERSKELKDQAEGFRVALEEMEQKIEAYPATLAEARKQNIFVSKGELIRMRGQLREDLANNETKQSELAKDLEEIRRRRELLGGGGSRNLWGGSGLGLAVSHTVLLPPLPSPAVFFDARLSQEVAPEITHAWEKGMVVLLPGLEEGDGVTVKVNHGMVSDSRARVHDQVLQMRLEREMKSRSEQAVTQVCEATTDAQMLYLAVLVRLSADCAEDKDHKRKLIGCAYTCDGGALDTDPKRVPYFSVTASDTYRAFLWDMLDSRVRLSVLRAL